MSEADGERRVAPSMAFSLGVIAATAPFSLDAYLPALPAMAEEFGVSPQLIQLSLTACLLGLGIGQLIAGPIGDRFGRRNPMVVGAALYAVASLGCAFVTSADMLIALRLVQGLAGAVGIVLSRAVVQDLTEGRSAARTYSQMAAVSGAAPVIAPVVGAVIIAAAGWRVVFVLLACLGLVMIAIVLMVVGETRPPDMRTSLAFRPVMRSFGHLLKDGVFVRYAVVVMLSAAVLFTYISSAPFVLQGAFDMTELEFALVFASVGAGLVLASQLNARLLLRFDPRRILVGAAVIQLIGILALCAVIAGRIAFGVTAVPLLVVCLVWAIVPCGAITPTCVSLAMARSGARAGSSSALLGVSMFLVGAAVSPISGAADPAITMAVVMLAASCGVSAIALARRRRGD
jgi:DHA1 family bicyclomycin/chloramphenicol resistance-like MFS transporter